MLCDDDDAVCMPAKQMTNNELAKSIFKDTECKLFIHQIIFFLNDSPKLFTKIVFQHRNMSIDIKTIKSLQLLYYYLLGIVRKRDLRIKKTKHLFSNLIPFQLN